MKIKYKILRKHFLSPPKKENVILNFVISYINGSDDHALWTWEFIMPPSTNIKRNLIHMQMNLLAMLFDKHLLSV